MRISELASRAGVGQQTLRDYERRGLLKPSRRAGSSYREYGAGAVREVRFIRRAQELGFTLEEIRDLLALWPDSSKSCSAVERRASVTLARTLHSPNDARKDVGPLAEPTPAAALRLRFAVGEGILTRWMQRHRQSS